MQLRLLQIWGHSFFKFSWLFEVGYFPWFCHPLSFFNFHIFSSTNFQSAMKKFWDMFCEIMSLTFRLTWMTDLCALTINEYIAYVVFEFSTYSCGFYFFVVFLLRLVRKYEGVFIQSPTFFSDNTKFKVCTLKQNQLHFFLICGLWIVHILKCNGV